MCAKCGCGCKPGKPAAGCKCTCPTCAKAKDNKQDAKVMKNMTPAQMLEFKKKDKKMDKKKPSAKEDSKMDKALAKKIKAKKK
jgi:hypothetical protein